MIHTGFNVNIKAYFIDVDTGIKIIAYKPDVE